jgi:translin
MSSLDSISDSMRKAFLAKNTARDDALRLSRELIRQCAESIRATHRREWDNAGTGLNIAQASADGLREIVKNYPDLYHSGYVQDALKEVVEAFVTFAIIRGEDLPTPEAMRVDHAAYLNGLAEAATELRRFILDILRREDADVAEAERLLDWMDAIYDKLVTFDFPDAITGDLRRRTDVVRGVLERTRGDLTTTIQQHRLQAALRKFESRGLDE